MLAKMEIHIQVWEEHKASVLQCGTLNIHLNAIFMKLSHTQTSPSYNLHHLLASYIWTSRNRKMLACKEEMLLDEIADVHLQIHTNSMSETQLTW